MACGSCGQKGARSNPNIEYQVTTPDGATKTVTSVAEAQTAISKAGGGSFKPVQAAAKK